MASALPSGQTSRAEPVHAANVSGARVVYLYQSAVAPHDVARFGIEHLCAAGARVKVLDVASIAFPKLDQDRSAYGTFESFEIEVVPDAAALRDHAATLDAADLIICLAGSGGVDVNNLPVFRAIVKSGTPYLTLSTNVYPASHWFIGERGAAGKRLRHILRRARQGRIRPVNSILARLPRRMLGVPHADFTVLGGRMSGRVHPHIGPDTRVIRAHSMDYELAREYRSKPIDVSDTALFIDEAVPFHRDPIGIGAAHPVMVEDYYPPLCRFFDKIEDALGLRVVIAASPRIDYGELGDIFAGREIVTGRTMEAVAASRLVLGHRSTALGFAVIFRNPVMILTLRALYPHAAHRPFVDAFAAALGRRVVMIDGEAEIDLSRALEIDNVAYDRYFDDYVKAPGSPDAPLWKIVTDAIDLPGLATS